MAEFLFQAHSGLRYLVLVAAAVAIVAAVVTWRRGRGPDLVLTRVFVGVLDLQVLLGLLLLLVRPFYGQLIGHVVMMIVAAAVAHIGAVRARRRTTPASAAAARAITIAVTLIVIVAGIMAIQRPIL